MHIELESEEKQREIISQKLLPILDTMELLSGRWKIIILTALYVGGKMRFNALKQVIPAITGRMLSKELKVLEEHGIVVRTVKNTMPVTVTYELSSYGHTLDKVFVTLTEWGTQHRQKMMKP